MLSSECFGKPSLVASLATRLCTTPNVCAMIQLCVGSSAARRRMVARRRVSVHSADGWESVLTAGCRTIQGEGLAHLFPGGSGVRESGRLRVPRSRADQIRDPIAGKPHPAREDRPSSDAPDWAAAERGAAFLCKFHLSGGKLDKAAPGHRQG